MALELMTTFRRCHVILLARLSFRRPDSRKSVRSSVVFQIQNILSKNFLAALVECIAATVLHALEQSFHCLKPLNPLPELLDFPLRELMPALRWTRPRREPEKELAYFIQGEPRLSSTLHHRQTKKHTVIVTTLAVLPERRWKNPDLLVVANGRGAQTKHARDFGDSEVLCHSEC